MFNVDVVSDPSYALFPIDPMWSADLLKIREYDENLVKPLVLFAESINLHSTREDMLSLVHSNVFRVSRMPMRRLWSAVGVSYRRDPEELEALNIGAADLIPTQDAVSFFESEGNWEHGTLVEFEERFIDEVLGITDATLALLRARRDELASEPLRRAVEDGLLQSNGWEQEDADPWSLAWRDEANFWMDGAIGLAEILGHASGPIMLDAGTEEFFGPAGASDATGQARRDLATELASTFVSRLPTLRELSLEELLEIRTDLQEYVIPFRAAMADMSSEIAAVDDAGSPAIAQEIERRWVVDVAPTLNELGAKVRSTNYPRALLAAFSEDPASLTAAASSVGLAAGSVFAGVSTLIPAAAAASVPFLRALNSHLKSVDEGTGNRLYFLYRAGRIGRRRGRPRR